MSRNFRIPLVLLVIAIIAVAAYAFAAANTGVVATKAGEGSAAITGYAVSGISYTLGANPTNLDSVGFTLSAAATQAQVQVVSGGSWYACTNTSGFIWACDTTSPQATVATMNQLDIVAADH